MLRINQNCELSFWPTPTGLCIDFSIENRKKTNMKYDNNNWPMAISYFGTLISINSRIETHKVGKSVNLFPVSSLRQTKWHTHRHTSGVAFCVHITTHKTINGWHRELEKLLARAAARYNWNTNKHVEYVTIFYNITEQVSRMQTRMPKTSFPSFL